MPALVQLDTSLVMYLNSLVSSSPFLVFIARLIGVGGIFIIILFGIVSLFYTFPGLKISGPFLFLQMLLSGVFSWVANNLIGALWFRERPYVQHPESIDPFINIQLILKSFPSDHSALAMALAVIVTLYLPKVGIPFIVLAVLIGIARVAAGVHFPIDILIGFVLGAGIALIVHKIFI